ncbi:MAG: alpha/beta family hydrolase [Vulcanococcus sp.]
MTAPAPLLIDGPPEAPLRLLLAHGAGASRDSPFMAAIASGLAQRGWQVLRFNFPYMARQCQSGKRCAPDRLPALEHAFRDHLALAGAGAPLLIGGKSMGGRVASLLVDAFADAGQVIGCACLGYPFHPPGKPHQLRTDHLEQLRTPTLILQGERDPFGRRAEVESYALSAQIQLHWLVDGDHSFKPTVRSGLHESDQRELACAALDRFGRDLTNG